MKLKSSLSSGLLPRNLVANLVALVVMAPAFASLASSACAQSMPAQSPQPPVATPATGKAAEPATPNAPGSVTSQVIPTTSGEPAPFIPAAAPAPPPPGPTGRPRIGLALGGGGAVAMSEIGVLEWFEEHHIPVDMIAGTSMGCMVSALYASGHTVQQLKVVMDDQVFSSVFSLGTSYKALNYRRREDARALPNSITVGLKNGISFRNAVLVDQGLNAFLDRQFLPFNEQTEFNNLPIPLRCMSTDLNDARSVTFTRGSLPDAVRASVSIPGVYRPYNVNGHFFVDGAVLRNLPTQTIRDMKADVILAVSLPLTKATPGDFSSILGVLQRSFAVAIEENEQQSRALANVLITPDVDGFGATDYLQTPALAIRGFEAADRQRDQLLKYALNDQDWAIYLAQRKSRIPGAPGTILHIHVKAPSEGVAKAVQKSLQPLVDKPVDAKAIEAVLDQVRSDGRYEADYTVGYELNPDAAASGTSAKGFATASSKTSSPSKAAPIEADANNRPVVQVTVKERRIGPPFLQLGTNVEAQTSGVTRATLESIFVYQDLGGYGSELRANVKVGFMTELSGEYARRLTTLGRTTGGVFVAPQFMFHREPFFIFQDQRQVAERQLQNIGGGADLGWSDERVQEIRAGWQIARTRWMTRVGSDNQPDISGSMQRARVRYVYDNQDRSLVPQFGIHVETEAAYLYNALNSPNAPQFTTKVSYSHQIQKNLFIMAAEAGTMLNRNVAQPFRFNLGGPLRLTASAIGEYRGTDYFLLEPAFLRRIAKLPEPLGQSIYIGAAYEAGQMRAPDARTITRQDVYFGIVAETPLGIITFAPAIGDDGHRKLVFTLGKLF